MSTSPRNPRYFPRMKVRGANRRRKAPWQRAARAFGELGNAFRVSAAALTVFARTYTQHDKDAA